MSRKPSASYRRRNGEFAGGGGQRAILAESATIRLRFGWTLYGGIGEKAQQHPAQDPIPKTEYFLEDHSMKRIAAAGYLFLCCAIGASVPVQALGPPEKLSKVEAADQAQVLAGEDAFLRAQQRRDFAGLANAMASEATYKTNAGLVQNKTQFLQALQAERTPRNFAVSDRIGTLAGGLGVTHGTIRAKVGRKTVTNSYLASYVKRSGRWQLVAWQTLPPMRGN